MQPRYEKFFPVFLFSLSIISGCNSPHVIPDHLENRLNTHVTLEQIQQAPDDYIGELVAMGGKVLSVYQQDRITSMEVLHVPLTKEYVPIIKQMASRERFIARCSSRSKIDPGVIKPDTVITLVGELRGSQPVINARGTQSLAVFDGQNLTIWGKDGHGGTPNTRAGIWYSPFHVPYGYRPSEGSDCFSD